MKTKNFPEKPHIFVGKNPFGRSSSQIAPPKFISKNSRKKEKKRSVIHPLRIESLESRNMMSAAGLAPAETPDTAALMAPAAIFSPQPTREENPASYRETPPQNTPQEPGAESVSLPENISPLQRVSDREPPIIPTVTAPAVDILFAHADQDDSITPEIPFIPPGIPTITEPDANGEGSGGSPLDLIPGFAGDGNVLFFTEFGSMGRTVSLVDTFFTNQKTMNLGRFQPASAAQNFNGDGVFGVSLYSPIFYWTTEYQEKYQSRPEDGLRHKVHKPILEDDPEAAKEQAEEQAEENAGKNAGKSENPEEENVPKSREEENPGQTEEIHEKIEPNEE